MMSDGFLIVDKPGGLTSLGVVRQIKRRFHVRKAGHIGTLDPFATGVLPIALNEGTKLIPFLGEESKEYEAVMKLGEETTTDDLSGEVVFRKPWEELTPGVIDDVFGTFLGKTRQIPPMFSAIKVQGKPLYRFARRGIEVERKEREVEIFSIQIEKMDLPNVHFRVSCSRGTYIRSLARDIGRRIGCGAHLLGLRRVRSGCFTLDEAISWRSLNELSGAEDLWPRLIPLKEAVSSLPQLIGDDQLVKKIRLGHGMAVRDLSSQRLPDFEKGQWLRMCSPKEGLVAILRSEVKGVDIRWASPEIVALRPLRIFHPQGPLQNEGHV